MTDLEVVGTADARSRPHVTVDPAILFGGTPVVLISTLNRDGTANLAPMSSAFWLGHTGVLGLGLSSHLLTVRVDGVHVHGSIPPCRASPSMDSRPEPCHRDLVRLWRWVAVGVASLVVLGVLLSVYVQVGVPIERRRVAIPADGASPAQVLRTYFEALDANDVSTQEAMWVPGRWPDGRANRVRAVTELETNFTSVVVPQVTVPPELASYPQRARVTARYRLHYWPLQGWNDQENGELAGNYYLLVRTGPSAPWRIWALGYF